MSVISILAKVLESIVHDQVYDYLGSNNILKEEQAGFRPNRSTQDIFLRTIDDWKTALDPGHVVVTVMIDLSKAFDTINHNLLIEKLDAYGIHGIELFWFSNYLFERRHRVLLDGEHSDWTRLTKGVPQGSILGPMLFLLFVNDLSDVVQHCTVNLYANDTTIYSTDENPVVLGARMEKGEGRLTRTYPGERTSTTYFTLPCLCLALLDATTLHHFST